MTDTEVLLAAADLIERNGLHDGEEWPGADRGEEWHPGDPCCVLGAIALVTGDFPEAALVRRLRTAVGGGVSERVERLTHPGRGSNHTASSSDV